MTPHRRLSCLAFAILSSMAPLCAQTPLFTDGPAFGGSQVFSEGRNPLGNSARYDQAAPGWYFTYLDGQQRAQDNANLLKDAVALTPDALPQLQNAPWAQRTRAFGLAGIKDKASFAFTREELNSMMASPDVDPAHAGTPDNTTTVEGRRAVVNRISIGGGSTQSGTGLGGSLRLEQWEYGMRTAALNPGPDQFPMTNLDSDLLGSTGTSLKTLTYALDMGFVMDLAQGLRVGITADQLNGKHLWDVYLQPQFRAGLQIDLGSMAKLSAETDLNAAARMPFPAKQQNSSASLRLTVSPAVAFVLGAERRKIGDWATTKGGITLQLRTSSFLLSLAMQVGQDTPLRGATLMVN